MASPKRAFLAILVALAVVSCQTITEEMPTAPAPTSPTSGGPTPVPIPVVVVPVPVPVPTTGPPTTPLPTTPGPTNPTPKPPNNPNPNPNPTPKPPNNPGNTGGSTVRIGAKVYFVERNGQILEGSENATEALVGDRVHLDATAKDAQNLPTNTQGPPHWSYSSPSLVSVSGAPGDWTPVMLVKHPGVMSVYVEADGIRSNTVTISFR
jgi:hypothetical protein